MAFAPAHGMGFGRIASSTQLGQPLNFTSVVNLEGDESLTRDCVFAEVVAGDTRIAPGFVRVSLENGSGERERIVRVSTSTPIDEPVVAISVSLGCASRTTRRFVEFVDPPGVALAQAAPAVVEPTAPSTRRVATAGSPSGVASAADVEREGVSASIERSAAQGSAPAGDDVAAAGPATIARSPAAPGGRRVATAPRKPPAVRQASASARAGATGARLQLDAPSVSMAAGPAASGPPAPAVAEATVATASAPASASDAEVQAALLDQERHRVRSLEEAVARLQADSQAQRQALAALQIRTRGTRSERYANPFVYTLAALCLLLTMTVCGLLGRRSRDRAAARWLTGPSPGDAAARGLAEVAAGGAATASPPLSPEVAAAPPAVPASAAAVGSVVARATAPGPVFRGAALPVAGAPDSGTTAPVHRDSVDELVDLEQQADFFVVLGQDDAAIELLREHADAGPLPLLKLMEIHRRLGDRVEYEKVRSRVVRHFNARAPQWPAEPGRERSLEEYPEVLARLEALWATPAAAMQTLDALMFRRGAEDASFDLPAYRELMLLHSIARDREAGESSAAAPRVVDLLLPIGPAAQARPIARLTATGDAAHRQAAPAPAAPVGLRVPIPALRAPSAAFENAETMPSALRRAPGYANESSFVDLELEFPGLPTASRSS